MKEVWLVYDKSLFSDEYGECGDIDEFMSEILVFLKEEEANIFITDNSNLIVRKQSVRLRGEF